MAITSHIPLIRHNGAPRPGWVDSQSNPLPAGWYWKDASGVPMGPFATPADARADAGA